MRCTKHLERRIFRQANPKSHVYNLYDRTDLLNNANADRLCLVKRLKSLEISKIGVCQASQSKIQVPRHQEPFGLNAWLPCSNTLSFDNCLGGWLVIALTGNYSNQPTAAVIYGHPKKSTLLCTTASQIIHELIRSIQLDIALPSQYYRSHDIQIGTSHRRMWWALARMPSPWRRHAKLTCRLWGRNFRADGIVFLRSQDGLSLSQPDLIQVESSPLDAACAAVLNNESAHPKVTAKTLLYFARFSMLWSAWLSAREEACLISLN